MFNRNIIKHLEQWKSMSNRKPLVLRGGRQVGKTSAVLMFGEKHFKNVLYVNLENVEYARLFREESISVQEFKDIVRIKFSQALLPGETLVFLDEIQNAPCLIKLLRFFYEQMPELHVIASGSLLDVIIEREGFSFPVGRVEFAYMYPLDFFEFLGAKKDFELLEYLKNISLEHKIPEAVHRTALKQYYEYAMIGGMPEIVSVFTQTRDIRALTSLYAALLTGYREDVYKYSSSANSKYLHYVIEKAPLYAGTAITYDKFGDSHFRSREMAHAFSTLERVMLLYQAWATKSTEIPLTEQFKRPRKLLFLDVGLVNYQMGIQGDFLNVRDLGDLYRGRIAEQVVGQNILAQFVYDLPKVLYWAREKTEGIAEVDFCLQHKGKIVGIEVKSGTANKLKSLFSFANAVKNSRLIRVYSGMFKEEKIEINGKSVKLLSIPFYLTPRILEEWKVVEGHNEAGLK